MKRLCIVLFVFPFALLCGFSGNINAHVISYCTVTDTIPASKPKWKLDITDGMKLSEVARTLKKWYGKTLVFDSPGLGDTVISTVLYSDDPLTSLLKKLKNAGDINSQIVGDTVHLKYEPAR